jgi:NRPS condensation-like uncharacterized protein
MLGEPRPVRFGPCAINIRPTLRHHRGCQHVQPVMTTIPLNLLDELYLNLDRETEPWTVHYEVQLDTHLDAGRLARAVSDAARRHPLARARLMGWRFQDRGYDWDIVDELEHVPLSVVECEDDETLGETRERLFSESPSLAAAPPFALVLARRESGDTLMLNLHHAAGDGISAQRFVLSIMRAYAGLEDPVPALDPLAVHDVQELAAARSARERLARRRTIIEGYRRPLRPVARVASDGGDDRPAYGFDMFALSADESRILFTGHPASTTVNDLLLAALAVAIRRWNSAHGCPARPIAISMPINLRPPEWRLEIFSNFASWVTVWSSPESGEDVSSVVMRVASRTGAIKRDRLGGLAVDLLRVTGRLMIAAKRWLQYLKAFTGDAVVDTASLSNLGSIESLPLTGAPVSHVWFSPPSQMPLGVAIGAVTLGGRLHVTLRYRHAQFDRRAAHRFLQLYRSVLLDRAPVP